MPKASSGGSRPSDQWLPAPNPFEQEIKQTYFPKDGNADIQKVKDDRKDGDNGKRGADKEEYLCRFFRIRFVGLARSGAIAASFLPCDKNFFMTPTV